MAKRNFKPVEGMSGGITFIRPSKLAEEIITRFHDFKSAQDAKNDFVKRFSNNAIPDVIDEIEIKIDPEGNTLKIFGSVGNDKGKFVEPKDIVLDDRGYLFVADFANNRIQKFETPIVMKIEEVLAAELAKKLEELTYEEESKDTDVVSNEEEIITDVPPVRDLTNPILEPPRDITIEATGSFTAVDIGEAMAMDESGIQFLINNAPERFGLGTAIIIWTAIDNSGNSTIATQEVSVVDTTPPTISSVSDMIVEAAVPYENIVNLEAPTAYDILGVVSVISDAPEFFPLGETLVTWTATDVVDNTST
ncbi:MAG TPA: HYR domain-containing protein, partial [Candidatus Nitrosopelagicus sp.]|nr:HYR domain-containing protein [Candidatus Nitrosopelagicus sp.]